VAASVPANKIGRLLRVPGVVAVQRDSLEQPLDDATAFIGATNVWPTLGGQDNAASNVVVGVIDSGIWPESPYFVDRGLPAPPHPLAFYHCDFGDGSDVAHLGPTFACNNKLIGAYNFTQTYLSIQNSDGQEFCNDTTHVCSARDSEGHGTHTASTAAGDRVDHAVLYGVDRGPVSGVAPGAHVIAFRVCLVHGCYSSDSVGAVQQAIHDGVNVLNFSISGGANPYTDPVELAFLDAENAGISVSASAGNSGPGASTADHGGPWVTTVGAATSDRFFNSMLHLTADGGATLDVPGVTITNGISSPTPVVMAASLPKAGGGNEDALCQSDLAAGAATGKIVVCSRGNNGRIDKGRRVLAGGAAGMILFNTAAVTDLETDNHYLPAIHTQFNSNSVANFVNGHTNVMAAWATGVASPTQGDIMASFSSRGPTGDWIKPDISAPGIQVLAGTTPQPDQTTADNGPPGNLFMAIAGTSMAAPHVAGSMALVKAAHPTWTAPMIKSALMTSAVQDVVKEDGTTPATPFDTGSGALRVNRAINPTIVFNETYANFVAAGSDTIHRVDLNIPSIDETTMGGSITTHRTAMNVSGHDVRLTPTVTAPAGVKITVGNNNKPLFITDGATLTFPVKISAPAVSNGQYLGRIALTPKSGGTPVTIPVAFVKTQANVTLTHTCSPTSFGPRGVSHCAATVTNLANQTANVNLNVDAPRMVVQNVSDPATPLPHGLSWTGSLTPAQPPQVTGFTPTTGPDGGYLDLSLLGVPPVAGVGDDTITNFNVPTFYYGAESYTRIGVVSNGYVVVGGGDSGDIVFTPQHFPVAARPNNTVAPLWTDLNPAGGGAIRVASLSGGANDGWVVVDWGNVKNFGNATTHSFEIWFQIVKGTTTGPASEAITFSYGPNTTFPGDGPGLGNAGSGDPDSGVNWGAENRDGTSGANIPSAPANGSEYLLHTTAPTPGGSKSFTYDASSSKPGTYVSTASMTSNLTAGTTQVQQTLTVVPPGPVTHFKVKVSPTSAPAGTNLTVKVTAQDPANLTVTGYTGPITLSDLSGNLVVVSPPTWAGGIGTATVKVTAPYHNDKVTATDDSGLPGPPTGTSTAFDVT
jgi:subtilisin family serine protease